MALSVLSIPPITVARAKGSATGRYRHTWSRTPSHSPVGHGNASLSPIAPTGWTAPPHPTHSLPQKISAPAATATKAPGNPQGRRNPPTSATRINDQRGEPHQRVGKDLERGEKGDQQDGHPRDGTQEPGPRSDPTDPLAAEGEAELAEPHDHRDPHPYFPGQHGIFGEEHDRAHHAEHDAEERGGAMPNGMAVTSSRPLWRASLKASQL